MLAVAFYDIVLTIHILAVVVAFGPTFAYPLLMAVAQRSAPAERAALHAAQARITRTYVNFGLLVVILAGAYMATDRDLWSEPWVSGPLLIAVVLGGMASAVLGPREARLAELSGGSDRAAYEKVLGQVRLFGTIASLLVVVAIFLMTTKAGG